MRKLLLLFLLAAVPLCAQVAVAPLRIDRSQFLSSTGVPLASGCVNFFATGTSTPQAIYTDSTGTFQLPNPLALDAAGEASIWMTNTGYDIVANTGVTGQSCSVALGTQLWREVNKNPFSIINSGSNFIVASGIVDPGGSLGMLATRSDIPCLRFFIATWDCIVELNLTQTLANKTLTTPILNTPTLNTPVINGTSTGSGKQGTGVTLLSANTINNSSPICSDGSGTATTAICGGVIVPLISCGAFTPVTATNTVTPTNLQSCVILANALAQGNLLQIDLTGVESEGAAYTLTLATTIGGGTACTTTSGSIGAGSNQPWNVSVKFFVLTAGAPGTANMSCEYFSSAAGGGVVGPLGTVGNSTISVNTTVSNTIQVVATMSVANAGNTVTEQGLKAVIF